MPKFAYCLLFACLFMVAGCSVFSPRDPEDPIDEAGTFLQPDTPEQVVENIRAAISELNTPNYSRSFSTDLRVTPTATADAQDPGIWSAWSRAEEEQYFSTLAAAAQFGSNHELVLNDQNISIITDSRYEIDASYALTINHNRPDVPTAVQGRLIWVMIQGEDGLWHLSEWTDRELSNTPSWSDMKAAFVK